MKRFLLLILALTAAYVAQARGPLDDRFREIFPYKYEVRLGWGGYPENDEYTYMDRYHFGGPVYDVSPSVNSPTLEQLYGNADGNAYMTGAITGEFSMHINRWFSFSAMASFNYMWGTVYSQMDGNVTQKKKGASFTVIPQARFYWSNKKYVRWYSAVGVGMQAGGYDRHVMYIPAGVFTPIGVTFGGKVFGYVEWSTSTAYSAGQFGIGYRF